MMKTIATLTLPVALLAGTANAGTLYEQRGYEKCANAFEAATQRLHHDRDYLVNASEESTIYYLNGVAQTRDGVSRVRMACETTGPAHRVLSASVEPGQFAPATRVRVEVAGQ